MKILVDSSNICHKAFNAVMYQITNKIMMEEKVEKNIAKEKALNEITEELVLHSVFSMFETMKSILKSKNNDFIFAFDNGSWRKEFLTQFNSIEKHSINNKSYELKDIKIEYKEGRDKTGRNIVHNVLKNFENLLNEININTINIKEVEADDVIAMISKFFLKEDKVFIVSNDKDFIQLMKQENVYIYDTTTKEIKKKSIEEANEFYQTKILIEDSSDNISSIIPDFYDNNNPIPSIRFGEETSKKMVEEFKTHEKIIKELSLKIFNKNEEYFKKQNVLKIKSKKWFGNSITIDDNKNPIILYNRNNIDMIDLIEFKNNENEIMNNGLIFSNKEEEIYGKNLIKCFIKLENPLKKNSMIEINQIKNLIIKSSNFEEIIKNYGDLEILGKNNVIKSCLNKYTENIENMIDNISKIGNEFYNENKEEFIKNIIKYTKFDGIEHFEDNNKIKQFVPFIKDNIKYITEVDFNKEEKQIYELEDIENILKIYLNRNLKMMDFNYIPEEIQNIIKEKINNIDFNNINSDNNLISEVLKKYKLFSLSEKIKNINTSEEINLYI